ncbi:ATP-dependent DNA ligase [Cryptosporangium phraense]|uniref:Probable DNA ligase n=1 Tax=Cryptosporangium phraense TaxID=2593070 RepID=A0A545AF25_9ACTN|nr:ATP-dependent DNA ligase [Cryptosporangium phraense]TQS39931.1 ATP-dependent DNA ligase [Cryptosporangium phraense]
MLLADIAATGRDVAAVSGRKAKVERLATCLRQLSLDEVVPAVAWLCGELRQRQIGVGWASLRDLPSEAASAPTLTVLEVDAAFASIGALAGPGSVAARRNALAALFARATSEEQPFLRALLVGELRQGALAGVMIDAVASATGLPLADLRRALLLRGDLRVVAETALRDGAAGLAEFRLEVGRPLAPMLAQPAEDLADALGRSGPAAVEEKLDGARVQVHRSGSDVLVVTRSLDDITARVPEVVEAALALPVRSAVLDGEAIALRPDGRPQPFQVTASRVGSRTDVPKARGEIPLSAVLFDALHLDGADLLDRPASERFAALSAVAPAESVVRRVEVSSQADASPAGEFLARTLRRGHEGVVVKSLASPYAAGRRGGGWWKVKPRHTLDLVVLAAEWGHGRRRGWLSNLHLGARDASGVVGEAGGFVMLGKTFKGMTDAMLTWQTEHLLGLAVSKDSYTVYVRPELVVEIAFDGVQRSTRYPGGVTLRFARVKGYREDKRAEEADTLEAVQALYEVGV